MNVLPEDNTLVKWFRGGKGLKVSELEELFELADDDYLLFTDSSEKTSVKVKACVLYEYFQRKLVKDGFIKS